jgi:hypothetical protein
MHALMATLSRTKSSVVELLKTNARGTDAVSGMPAHGIFRAQDVGMDAAKGDVGATLALWNTVAGNGAPSAVGLAMVM